jgi:cardiolipin synthase
MIKLLTKKASEGVEVRVLYDAIGSLKTSKHSFKKLRKASGKVAVFFPPFLNIKLFNLKANYRNHRKICVIDGNIGYIGGFNVRDDHLGRNKRFSPWRDTTTRLQGGAVHSLQNIFLSDWRFASKDSKDIEGYLNEKYFPKISSNCGSVQAQVISSGPDNIGEPIKECMIKMITTAKKSVKIQTPYFVPDDHFIGTLKLALLSGIEVSLIVPKKYDHWFVYFAGLNYISDLLKYGLKVYFYNGFIHSKVLMIDDKIMTLGSCNIDIRSFSLNFEDNIVLYDEQILKSYAKQFEEDTKNCELITEKSIKKMNLFAKFVMCFCRLFSAIL